MYQFKNQEGNEIEIVLGNGLTDQEFKTMAKRIESLPSYKDHINIIFDTRELHDHYTFKVFLDEHKFSKKYQPHLQRVVFVSDDDTEVFLLDQYVNNVEPEFKTCSQIEEARKWLAH